MAFHGLPATSIGGANLYEVDQLDPKRRESQGTTGGGLLPRDGSEKLAAFDQHRALLLSIAYRMLGSVADAEDMVQETFIRWQQASTEEIQSPRAFLVTIVSRLCINYLQSARVQREQYIGHWLPEPLITELASDPVDTVQLDESLSMAFLALLERLNPIERAAFILREVFDYEYKEIAEILGQNEVNCRQILRRARQHLATMRPRFTASQSKRNELLERFVRASGTGDLKALITMLEEDVVLYTDGGGKAFAVPNPIYGAANVARAIAMGGSKFHPKEPVVFRRMSVNGTPGVVTYLAGRPLYVLAIDIRREHISSIYFVTNPDKLTHIPVLDEQASTRLIRPCESLSTVTNMSRLLSKRQETISNEAFRPWRNRSHWKSYRGHRTFSVSRCNRVCALA